MNNMVFNNPNLNLYYECRYILVLILKYAAKFKTYFLKYFCNTQKIPVPAAVPF